MNHCLVGPAVVALADVREIHSHPVALDQCRKLVASLPNAIAVAAPTTGDAASIVAELADPAVVAIASDRAARINGLTVIDGNVGDHPEAYTRFVSVAPYTRLDRRDGQWRTAFSFTTDHRPGALHHALEPLARHRIDLNLLVSRPIPSAPFSYRFDAVLSGHPLDPEISSTLREMRDLTALAPGVRLVPGRPRRWSGCIRQRVAARCGAHAGAARLAPTPLQARSARARGGTAASSPGRVGPRGG